jgi:hypothetical protein
MLFELKLGTLIRRLNPYTNGSVGSMQCIADPPAVSGQLAAALTTIATDISNYQKTPNSAALQTVEGDEVTLDPTLNPIDINLEIDNDYKQSYMNWTFRGNPYAVKRALLIQYRYELSNSGGPTGIFATDHVLIGYAGGNGG